MKNIMLIFVLSVCAFSLTAQSNSKNVKNNVVKNVVLINKNPWEVLMNKNGDIFAKLQSKPKYLSGVSADKEENPVESDVKVQTVVREKPMKKVIVNEDLTGKHLEVAFATGSALLRDKDIRFLNGIADYLNLDRNRKYKLFSFGSEPSYRFYILSNRRVEAVLGYLKVKGVDIDSQIIVGSKVQGTNNKIVFTEVR